MVSQSIVKDFFLRLLGAFSSSEGQFFAFQLPIKELGSWKKFEIQPLFWPLSLVDGQMKRKKISASL